MQANPLNMDKEKKPTTVLWVQSAGFLAVITVCMIDELTGLTGLILENQPYITDFRSTILKALLILGVWLLVTGSTRRLLDRAQYLESFMRICAWCRRIEHKGQFMSLEEFFQEGFDTPTSHGICQECLEKTKAAIERSRQSNRQAEQQQRGEAPAGV